ncbi:MAG: cold-shock protein [Rhodospirillaceae bacterium]|jgi:cold shock protein|nr:cold-shock protein [Rhodospirillaceae bacterium]MBT6139301.1 cold-shock protein [Rhodospirillaceae bacterium]
MATGIVKWFNATKGYGFITPDEGGGDVFVHVTAIQEAQIAELAEGQKISFDMVPNRGRTAAGNLKLL